MAIVKISDLPLVDSPVEGTDLFVVVQDNVTKKAYASDIQTYVGFEEFQTATAGQTVYNLTTMTYAAGANNLMVFVDGVNQYVGASYLETDNNTVTFTQGLHVGALVKFSTVQTLSTVDTSSEDILFTQGGVGAVTRSVQSKLRDTVSVKDYGAVGDGVVDDTAAIQAAVDAAKTVYFPAGSYKFSRILIRHNNCALVGDGQFRTFLVSTVTTGAAIFNPDQATVTRYYCSIRGMQISTPNMTAPSGSSVIDWRSIQFGELKDLWLIGNSATGQAGIILGTITYGVTECTYNYLQNIYIGFVGYGVLFYDGANTNTLMNMRIQPGANSFGYHLAFGTAADRIGNNTFIACHCEFPGNTVTGYALGTGAKNTTIIAPRIEGLATGFEITANALNTSVYNPYFDSTTTNISNASTSTTVFGPNGFSINTSAASPNWGTEINYNGYPGAVVRFKGATGGETQTFNNSTAVKSDGVYASGYGGGTNFGVGANGFYSLTTGGDYGIGTSDANWLGLGSNALVRAKVQPNGAINFVPLASDPTGAVAGDVYYNSGTNKLRCYNGTSWNDLF
jgi:hypothetical protein